MTPPISHPLGPSSRVAAEPGHVWPTAGNMAPSSSQVQPGSRRQSPSPSPLRQQHLRGPANSGSAESRRRSPGRSLPSSPPPSGTRTPTRDRIMKRLMSTAGALTAGERLMSALNQPNFDPQLGEMMGPLDHALKQVLEVVENVLNVTLVSSESTIDLHDVAERLTSWRKRLDAEQRRLSQGARSPITSTDIQIERDRHDRQCKELRAELDAARSQARELKNENERFQDFHKDQAAALKVEISKLKSENRDLRGKEDSQIMQCWRDLEEAQTQIELLKARVHEQEQTIANGEREMEIITRENTELAAKVDLLSKRNTDFKSQISQLTTDKQHLQMQQSATAVEIEQVMNQVRLLQEKGQRVATGHLDEHRSGIEADRLQVHLEKSKESLRQVESELRICNQDKETLSKHLDEANKREDELRNRLRDSEKQRRELDEKLASYSSKLSQLKTVSRKREEDLFAAKKLLEEREKEIKDLSAQFNRTYGEKEQVSVIRRNLEQQLNQVRSECDRHVNAIRMKDQELNKYQAELRILHDDLSELKTQHQLLGSIRQRVDREKKQLEDTVGNTKTLLKSSEETLAQTRKDLETTTLRLANLEDAHNKLQRKLQESSERHENQRRDLAAVRQESESREKQLATVELAYKQVLTDNKEMDHKLKTLDARLNQKQEELQRILTSQHKEVDGFNEKLSSAFDQIKELDKQLVQAKASFQLANDERNRLTSDNKNILHKLEKYREQKRSLEDQLSNLREIKEKYQRAQKDLKRYKSMYEHALEAGLFLKQRDWKANGPMDALARMSPIRRAPDDSTGSADWDLAHDFHMLWTRCRRLIQSAASYTPHANSESLATANLNTTESMLEALEMVVESLCRQAARAADVSRQNLSASKAHSNGFAGDANGQPLDTSGLANVHRQFLSCAEKVETILNDLGQHHHLDDGLVHGFRVAVSALKDGSASLPLVGSASEGFRRSPSPSRGANGMSRSPTRLGDPESRAPMGLPAVVQTHCSFIRLMQDIICSLGKQLLAKFKDVVVDIQSKAEREIEALSDENVHLKDQVNHLLREASQLKDKLARVSILVDRSEQIRHKTEAHDLRRREAGKPLGLEEMVTTGDPKKIRGV